MLLISALILVLLDGLYLKLIRGLFTRQIKSVQGSELQMKLTPAIIAYIFLVFGLNYFIISKKGSVKDAALLGLVIYAVYEFTNLSLLKNWTVTISVIDTLWGALLFGLTTWITYKISRVKSI